MVDIEIKAWSYLFLNLETKLINLVVLVSLKKCIKFNQSVAFQKTGNLKFCASFQITMQKREGPSNFEKPVFDFSVHISKKEWIKQDIKSVHIGYSD